MGDAAPARPESVQPARLVRTGRLTLVPPGRENLPDLIRLKTDPRVFELMLHGVRSEERVREELEDDIDFWAVRGYGTWCVYRTDTGEFLGIAGTNAASEVTPRPGGSLDLDYTRRLAQAHEDNGWDRILFAYHSGSPDPARTCAPM